MQQTEISTSIRRNKNKIFHNTKIEVNYKIIENEEFFLYLDYEYQKSSS